jgi:RsiW-degrading membrane proteinase PrsW (M82 family)
MWYFYRRDRHDPEPPRYIARVMGMGALAAIPAALAEMWLMQHLPGGPAHAFLNASIGFLIIVGPVEEFLKFFVVRRYAYQDPAFNEPMDGIQYAVAAAIGFATLENIGYALAYGPGVLFVRGPWCTLGHILFSSIWGGALGLTRFCPDPRFERSMIRRGLLLAALAHSANNVLLTAAQTETLVGYLLAGSTIPLGGLLLAILLRHIQRAQRVSPFRQRAAAG